MMNYYIADKRILSHEETLKNLRKTQNWEKWTNIKKREWLEKYKDRLEKFVVNVFYWCLDSCDS